MIKPSVHRRGCQHLDLSEYKAQGLENKTINYQCHDKSIIDLIMGHL